MSSTKVLENLTKNPYVGLGLTVVVVAVAGYFLLKKAATDTSKGLSTLATKFAKATGLSSGADAVSTFFNGLADSAPDGGTDTLASWYDPTQRTVFFYYVVFPDGNSHFVGGASVNTDGTFQRDTATYRLGNSKMGDLRAYPWNGGGSPDFGATGGGW